MEIKRFLVWKQSVLQSKCKANGGYSEFLPQNKIRQSQTQKNEERGMWLSGRVSLAHTRSQIESLRTQLGRNSSMKISTMILLLSILIQCNQKSLPRKHFWYFLSCCLIWMICVVLRHSGGLELNYEAGLHDKKKKPPTWLRVNAHKCDDEEEASRKGEVAMSREWWLTLVKPALGMKVGRSGVQGQVPL